MKTPVFTGTCTAIITPFYQDGTINYQNFSALIQWQLQAGVDAICVCGTTGESATLSIQEHIDVVDYCVKEVAGRCRVIAGTGSNDTATALELSLQAQDSGADALLLVTPYYNKTTQEGLFRHYTYVADRVDTPILLYNVPSRTGVSFTTETYLRLSDHPNINGVKEASGNFSLIAKTMALCKDRLWFWSGNDDHVIPMMALGAKGVISVASNLVPEPIVQMTHRYLEGKSEEAAAIQLQYAPLIDTLFSEVNPIPLKAAMQAAGMDSGKLRLPLWQMSEAGQTALLTEMQKIGIPVH